MTVICPHGYGLQLPKYNKQTLQSSVTTPEALNHNKNVPPLCTKNFARGFTGPRINQLRPLEFISCFSFLFRMHYLVLDP